MWSDSYDYYSSQDYSEIEYQIDLFEKRQYLKSRKQNKHEVRTPSYPISMKDFRSQHAYTKFLCMNHRITSKARQKKSRYTRYLPEPTVFECDEHFQTESTNNEPNLSYKTKHRQDFLDFCRQFYSVYHQKIKTSLGGRSNLRIVDIRLAPINESVQNNFMMKLNEDTSYFPHLVYHGTKLNNIESILHYGFLIPNEAHPTNSRAPIIPMKNGNAYGSGIYCSQTASYSLSYVNTTNTLLVCAAIPKRDKLGNIERSHGNILVLSHVSEIIPLFFIDFTYFHGMHSNYPWYNKYDEFKIIKKEKASKLVLMPKKYLRKTLNYMNDQVRRNMKYQVRIFDPFHKEFQFS